MVVQHNMQAMNTNRQLGITTGQQAKSTEKLSSGYKINRAGDDAAGLAISEKMRSQIRGLDKASTNAEDGISVVQTAEGALNEVHSILQRMNELATQAANDTNTSVDRSQIQLEIDQLTAEIDRIASTTQFNTMNLLDGSFNSKNLQVGALSGQSIQIDISAMNASALGFGTRTETIEAVEGKDAVAATATGTGSATIDDQDKLNAKATDNIMLTYVAARSAAAEVPSTASATGAGAGDVIDTVTVNSGFKLANEATYNYDATEHKWLDSEGAELKVAFDSDSAEDKAAADVVLKLKDGKSATDLADGMGIKVTAYTAAVSEVTAANAGWYNDNEKVELADYGLLSTSTTNGATINITKYEAAVEAQPEQTITRSGLSVSGFASAGATMEAVQSAIDKVSTQRAHLGAIQNRLEHTIANLDTTSENTSAAESRIRDTDMATEMVNYSKNNILAQAGQSMLAQANQSTQGVLSILG